MKLAQVVSLIFLAILSSCSGRGPSTEMVSAVVTKKVIKTKNSQFEVKTVTETKRDEKREEMMGAKADVVKMTVDVVMTVKADCFTSKAPQTEYKEAPRCFTKEEYKTAQTELNSNDSARQIASIIIINEFTKKKQYEVKAGQEFVIKNVEVGCMMDHTSKEPSWKCK